MIAPASSPADLDVVRALFREYEAWLEERAAEQGLDLAFEHARFESELRGLPGPYAPLAGRLLLATEPEGAAGCVAMRALSPGVCEMKRLWVRPAFRGRRLGHALGLRLLDEAREAGYRAMRLDTHPVLMPDAQRLYDALGFVEIPPYWDHPVPGVRFLERRVAEP